MSRVTESRGRTSARAAALATARRPALPVGWVWPNGEHVGHRPYRRPNVRPQPLDMDVTAHVKPGRKNRLAVWVSTGTKRQHAPEGLVGRALLYAPKQRRRPEPMAAPGC